MKKALSILFTLALIIGLIIPSSVPVSADGPVAVSYGDYSGSANWFSTHFAEYFGGEANVPVWDLTQGDLVLRYTLDMSKITQPHGLPGNPTEWEAYTGATAKDPGNYPDSYTPYIEVALRGEGASDFNPGPFFVYQGNCGGWMVSECDDWVGYWDGDVFIGDGTETQDLDDKHGLQASGGRSELDYDVLLSAPDSVESMDSPYWWYPSPKGAYGSWGNHGLWFDRDGVDQWQATSWSNSGNNAGRINTQGIYTIEITYHAIDANENGDKTDDGLGVMFATINGVQQGFYTTWVSGEPQYYPVGLSFKGDMEHMQVFAGSYAGDPSGWDYGIVHLTDISVNGYAGTSDPLVADFDYTFTSDVLSPGDLVQFNNLTHGGMPPYTYLWKFGDGATSTEQYPTHVYDTASEYTVELTVTPFRCVPKTITKTLNVVDTYDICGYKYAEWEEALIPMPGWEVTLEKWNGEYFEPYATTYTDEFGKYCFTDLPAGTYKVTEVVKDGWDQVLPEDSHIVELPKNIVYGIERSTGDVYGVDVNTGTSWLEFEIPTPPGANSTSPNGLAYDPLNGRFYYTDYQLGTTPDKLYFWDGESQYLAGKVAAGTIACGDIYNGKYYYIPSNTDDLYEITFDSSGFINADTKLNDISENIHRWTFDGDIAVNDGMVYGWGRCAVSGHGFEYFTYDLTTGDFTYIKPDYQASLQLAFGSDGVLYGHRSGIGGYFYAIDITDASVTLVEPVPNPALQYTDCASGQSRYNFINTPSLYCFDETGWAAYEPGVERFVPAPGNWATWIGYNIGDGSEADPAIFPIYAGQSYYSGDILAWDDGAILYVKYVASDEGGTYAPEGYCSGSWTGLTEYHLQVVDEFDGFNDYRAYSKKKGYGAPIPGSFDYIWEGDKVMETPGWIVIDITNMIGKENTDLFIAAHAVMWWCGYDCDVLEEVYLAMR